MHFKLSKSMVASVGAIILILATSYTQSFILFGLTAITFILAGCWFKPTYSDKKQRLFVITLILFCMLVDKMFSI